MQKTEDRRKGMETTEREGLDSMAWMEGQAAWSAGKVEKSKPGAENSRSSQNGNLSLYIFFLIYHMT